MGTANPVRSAEPLAVRCAGCRRTVGWTDGLQPLRNKMYCSLWCMEEPAATPTEARTDQWRMLRTRGVTPVAIGKLYGVAHSQVYVALDK